MNTERNIRRRVINGNRRPENSYAAAVFLNHFSYIWNAIDN
jgi:hypothetical protein